ncbi:MAG: T9SS type A sorting domain-containing protein [Desulfonatronovibrio sp.]
MTFTSGETASKPLLYPNPADDKVFISNLPSEGIILIRNSQGSSFIKKKIISKHQCIYLTGLKPGLYIVTIRNGNKNFQKKLIIR